MQDLAASLRERQWRVNETRRLAQEKILMVNTEEVDKEGLVAYREVPTKLRQIAKKEHERKLRKEQDWKNAVAGSVL